MTSNGSPGRVKPRPGFCWSLLKQVGIKMIRAARPHWVNRSTNHMCHKLSWGKVQPLWGLPLFGGSSLWTRKCAPSSAGLSDKGFWTDRSPQAPWSDAPVLDEGNPPPSASLRRRVHGMRHWLPPRGLIWSKGTQSPKACKGSKWLFRRSLDHYQHLTWAQELLTIFIVDRVPPHFSLFGPLDHFLKPVAGYLVGRRRQLIGKFHIPKTWPCWKYVEQMLVFQGSIKLV